MNEARCPYCDHPNDYCMDLLRIYLGDGIANCQACHRDFYIDATEIECSPIEDDIDD